MPDDFFRFGNNPLEDLVGKLFAGLGGAPVSQTRRAERFGRDLTASAREGALDPVVGRDDVIDEVVEVLSRRTKNNPVLLGDPGVGKTAIVEGIATRMATGDVPPTLAGRRLISIDLAAMVAGSKYRGEFEERLQGVMDEVAATNRMIVLFIDELHTVVGAGSAEGAVMDAANILKPALTTGRLQLIGATTVEEYQRHIAKDAALERRFQPVLVDEPSPTQTITILTALRTRYERHHAVRITDEAVRAAVELSARYVTDRFLPDKAIDLMDRAGARVRLRQKTPPPDLDALEERVRRLREDDPDQRLPAAEAELAAARATLANAPRVDADDIAEVVSRSTGVPVTQLTESERHRLLTLEDQLHRRIIGQDEAVEAVADAVRLGRAGLKHPNRPTGSFLFLGPTGVGKTEVARALAEALYGSPDRLIRFDMSEYAQQHVVPALTSAVRRTPYSVVLLDEIDKAHPEVLNTLLQLLDTGRLTDTHGRTTDFANTVVIMTSNTGPEHVLHLRPEFLNRLDETIVFRALDADDLRRITKLLLNDTRDRLAAQNITLDVTEEAVTWLATTNYTPDHGARPLRRTIAKELDRRLSRALLTGDLRPGHHVSVTVRNSEPVLTITGRPGEEEESE
ncbi:ATP-dependent Clp protease ATP-binding subunit ClpC [Actinosynnema sp. ALI-1.44]